MRSLTRHVAVAAVLGALSSPAFAGGDGAAASQECSVCNDPTWPELRDPAPPIVVQGDEVTATAAVQVDPTWPELQQPARAIVLRHEPGEKEADVLSDPTWPEMATAAPALEIERPQPEERVARR